MQGTNVLIHEAINDDYEYIQYNSNLRLIRCVKDDYYQMQSIIRACNSNKHADNWFANDSTQELLDEAESDIQNNNPEILVNGKLYENRKYNPPALKGYYVHRLLVNAVAMWASPKYAWNVMKLLDNIVQEERAKLEAKHIEQEQTIQEQRPRLVPKNKDTSYRYIIWKEDLGNNTLLHLCRRNKSSFREISKYKKDANKCWFFRDDLPIAMTINEDVKDIVRKTFPGDDYNMKGCKIEILTEHLPKLYQLITKYFDEYQE